jgi:hypothetical protein
MSRKELTPADLTFHSFRHSQGRVDSQLLIFRYFDLKFGLQPDLHPNSEEVAKYVRYLGGTGTKTHLQYQSGSKHPPDRAVFEAVKGLRDYRNSKPYRSLPSLPINETVGNLTSRTWVQETSILNVEQPWSRNDNGKQMGHSARVEARVKSGKSSFLYYYGRDGHSTGINEFDELYSDMWTHAKIYEGSGHESYLNFTDTVREAELKYAGRLILATPAKPAY